MSESGKIRWGQLLGGIGIAVGALVLVWWIAFSVSQTMFDLFDGGAFVLAMVVLVATGAFAFITYRRGRHSLAIGIAAGYVLLSVVSAGQCTFLAQLIGVG